MLELPAVTLVCIDCQQSALALAAIEQSMIRCRFGGVVYVSDKPSSIEGLNVVVVPDLTESGAQSRFVARDLATHLVTSHALLIGWDAFVINPDGWSDAFVEHDFVMARRKALNSGTASVDTPATGVPATSGTAMSTAVATSTGFALLSRVLLQRLASVQLPHGIDVLSALACGDPALDAVVARRPSVELRDRFAFGDYAPVGSPFGFERLFNMWMYFQPADLSTFIAIAPPAVLASRHALSLALNLHSLGRAAEATTLLKAIIATAPADNAAKDVLDAIGGRQSVVMASMTAAPALGRNDPCPCGSGRRYKQCHGALGATPLSTVAPVDVADAQGAPGVAADATASSFSQRLPRADGAAATWMHRARDAFRRNDSIADSLHRKVIEAEPDNAEATSYLGVIAMRSGRPTEAERWLKHAVALAPHHAEYHVNLGMFRQMRGDEAAALTAYADAIRLEPSDAAAHNNLGLLLQEMARPEAAIAAFRKAVDAVPAFADAHWNLALALLAVGDFEHGLEEQEWRFRAAPMRESWEKRTQFPTWRGEPLHGKRILILAEQGFGDILQTIRYAEALTERGASVVVEAPAEIAALMRTTRGVTLVAPRGGPFPPCDYQVALMSLPYVFGTRLDSIPSMVPYILPDVARSARWQGLLGEKTKLRVGINWSGNPLQARNRTRSIPLAMLEPLLRHDNIEWINLHKGMAVDDIARLPPELSLRDLMPHAADFADTAALIRELDLVITTDTAVAHLAGALGAPTLTLLDAAPDCRWLLGRDDSPWYPTMRLIRQTTRGDWSTVVDEAARELDQRLQK